MSTKPFDFDEMFRIQAESEAKLKNKHPKRTTRNRIKSVNNLNDQGRKLIDNTIEIIAEFLIKDYEKNRESYI